MGTIIVPGKEVECSSPDSAQLLYKGKHLGNAIHTRHTLTTSEAHYMYNVSRVVWQGLPAVELPTSQERDFWYHPP